MIAALTTALVLITGYYAWQQKRQSDLTHIALRAANQPRLALDINMFTPLHGRFAIRNVGTGPGYETDVTLTLTGGEREPNVRRWTTPVFATTDVHEFYPPRDVLEIAQVSNAFPTAKLIGTIRDAYGETHAVNETLDLKAWWALLAEADHMRTRDLDVETVSQIEGASKKLSELVSAVRNLRAA